MTEPIHYPSVIAFLDERVERLECVSRRIVGCSVFGHERWMALHHQESVVATVRRKRRLKAIDDLLTRLGGVAVLVYADIPPELLQLREVDGTTDIPRMSRTDNVWSQVTLSAVTAALAWVQRSGVSLGMVNLYYDRKDLTVPHRTQFENVLCRTLPEIAKEAAAEYPSVFTADPGELRFGAIQGVDKPNSVVLADAFQHGTNLAHNFCAQAAKVISRGSTGRTMSRNHTSVVYDMISKFTSGHTRRV